MKTIKILFILALLPCNYKIMAQTNSMSMASEGKTQKATCVLSPTQGNNVSGSVTFTKVKEGVKVVADIQGLSKGKHGFHIHDKGDCSAPDASSAGGHFNPESMNHGAPPDMMRHVGDLGNITADASGKAHYEYVDLMLALDGKNSIIGKSIIVHEMEDDLVTQPTGNSGKRVACGVIQENK
jgi:superoxide dismutase, Cu-Zn family